MSGMRAWRRSWARSLVQGAGFLAGLALLVWVADAALDDEGRAQLARLGDAPWWAAALVFVLPLVSLAWNGVMFWIGLLPVHRLNPARVIAVNATATGLAYLPFKLGLLFRVLVHHRGDRVGMLTIGAWFGALTAVIAAGLGPMTLVTLIRPRVDGVWVVLSVAGAVAAVVVLVLGARWITRGSARAWVDRTRARLGTSAESGGIARLAGRIARSRRIEHLASGAVMLAHPAVAPVGAGIRLADIGLQALRFLAAARVVGAEITPEQAAVAALSFFVLGVLAPTGILGVREAGTAGVFALMETHEMKLVILVASATEAVVNIGAACAGALWLKPWRLAGRGAEPDAAGAGSGSGAKRTDCANATSAGAEEESG